MSILLFALTGMMLFAAPTEADPTMAKESGKAKKIDATSSAKSTDMSFEELLIQGKYHFTDEAATTVEQDKVLDGLLEVRKDFKDRIQQSTTRY